MEPHASAPGTGCRITAFPAARPFSLVADRGGFSLSPDWYWHFRHAQEAERGLDAAEDLFRPGVFHFSLEPGQTVVLTASAEPGADPPSGVAQAAGREQWVCRATGSAPDWVCRLRHAAGQFLVARQDDRGRAAGWTVIAGFGDWGRDTLVALPGLMLATGRTAEGRSILASYVTYLSDGMLPNRFPDGGEAPEYNSVDATLWYFHALAAYLAQTGDRPLLDDLYPALKEMIHWYRRGTHHHIHQDPSDGLLHAGEPGVQLTWMDAKVGDWVVTPRIGKPVEVNALWHRALAAMGSWAGALGDEGAAAGYQREAQRVAASFDAFWCEEGRHLYDVIDGPTDGPGAARTPAGRPVEPSLRPNQILAVELAPGLFPADRARAVVDACAQELLTPVGLRSLAPRDPRYVPLYSGNVRERDGAYHQGTVWTWLLGPFALAHHQVYGDADHALALLEGLAGHLDEGCIGTISEIMDGAAPHRPRGCLAQAWSVAETYRAWHQLTLARTPREARGATGG